MGISSSDYLDIGGTFIRKPTTLTSQPANYAPTSDGWQSANVPSQNTDMGNSERLIQRHGDKLRYCYETGLWLVWTGKVWATDTGDTVMRLAKDTVRNIYAEASLETDDNKRRSLGDHAHRSESGFRLLAMINLARDLCPVRLADLDSNPMLFNVQNGTIDLETGILQPHRKTDYLTKISPVAYHPEATSDLWAKHLDKVTGGNADLMSYLQRVFGYCLTGETKEQSMFFIFGQTKTGKSRTVGAIMYILGDYARQTPSDTLLIKRNAVHNDIARLVGSRMVTSVENEKGEKLASALIKQLTGGDRMACRFLYHEHFEFEPTFKIFLIANDKPAIRGEDSAMWERLKLIPFSQFIPVPERDKDLADKLQSEAAGILAWMVKGCLEWQKAKDLLEPSIVTSETSIYRSEMDLLADFLDDRCDVTRTAKVEHTTLYIAYLAWCKDNEEEAISKKSLTLELQSRNFFLKRTGNKKVWHGLSLRLD